MGVKCCYFTRLKYFFCVAELEQSHFCTLSRAVRLLRQQDKHLWAGRGQGPKYVWALHPPSELQISHSVITVLKEGCLLSTLIPLIWFFLTPRWGQKQHSNKESRWCALKSTHTKFIYFRLSWRVGCVFFVQTLFLNSEAKHNLAFVGFFFFLELPFVCIGRKIALLLRISKSVLLLQPWRCSYIKERRKAFKYWNSF